MGLRRRISFHWRLFFPIALCLCVVFGFIIWYQYKREADYRAEQYAEQLDMISKRVLRAYQEDQTLRPFNAFVASYFSGSRFDGVRISVYGMRDGMVRYSLGIPIPFEEDAMKTLRTIDTTESVCKIVRDDEEQTYIVSSMVSPDGRIKIISGIPYDEKQVKDSIDVDKTVWQIILVCMIATLLVTYYFTSMLTRSVTLLKDFAYRASTGGRFTGLDRFPRNELGDISREIVNLYRERERAIELIKKERKVSIHAIEEKARVTRQMTNNINHEIKTPVGIIRGYLESILGDPDMDAETRTRFLQRMLSNVERLSNLLNDVSTMTRLENGSDKIAVNKVEMYDLVYQIENDLPASGIAGAMTFTFDIPIDCYVTGNYGLLHGMICGLIRNSSLHSGGTAIGLRLISESERFYVFSFYDNGSGAAEEHIPHLFERFYRVDSGRSRKQGGTGLGLPIVRSTVITLGGTISVHNRSTGGLEFIFSLPKWHGEDE